MSRPTFRSQVLFLVSFLGEAKNPGADPFSNIRFPFPRGKENKKKRDTEVQGLPARGSVKPRRVSLQFGPFLAGRRSFPVRWYT